MRSGLARGYVMSTAHPSHSIDPRGSKYVVGYLVAAVMILMLWIGLYGSAFKGSSSGVLAARQCAEIGNEATRLACHDGTNHPSPRPPGRGYAPMIR